MAVQNEMSFCTDHGGKTRIGRRGISQGNTIQNTITSTTNNTVNTMTVGTWNVRSMYELGKVYYFIAEIQRLNTLIKWVGYSSALTISSNCLHFFCQFICHIFQVCQFSPQKIFPEDNNPRRHRCQDNMTFLCGDILVYNQCGDVYKRYKVPHIISSVKIFNLSPVSMFRSVPCFSISGCFRLLYLS